MKITGTTTHHIDDPNGKKVRVQFFREDEDRTVPLTYRDYPAAEVEKDFDKLVANYAAEYARHLNPVMPAEIEDHEQLSATAEIDADAGQPAAAGKRGHRPAVSRKK